MESLGSNFQAYLNVIRLLLKISDCGAIVKLRAQKIAEARRVGTFRSSPLAGEGGLNQFQIFQFCFEF